MIKIFDINDKEFQRLLGIKRQTFNEMLEIVTEAHNLARTKGGVKSKLSIEQRLLMTIEFWKSDYTYFSIGIKYGVSESYAYKIITRFENYLIQSEEFSLPNIHNLKKENIVIVDSTEIDIQRPKKSPVKRRIILGKRKDIQ